MWPRACILNDENQNSVPESERVTVSKNQLAAYAIALESAEAITTDASLANQVRRAVENSNGITYDMAETAVRKADDATFVNGSNESYLSQQQVQEINSHLAADVREVMSENNHSVGSDRQKQIMAIAAQVEYYQGPRRGERQ
ncbi:MAG: hypothetical protein K2X27_26900 [Candidatus Obscuribacterales bacterium]|nr:hypothetical protein [Candidatus Obscuribacterales bacterium]